MNKWADMDWMDWTFVRHEFAPRFTREGACAMEHSMEGRLWTPRTRLQAVSRLNPGTLSWHMDPPDPDQMFQEDPMAWQCNCNFVFMLDSHRVSPSRQPPLSFHRVTAHCISSHRSHSIPYNDLVLISQHQPAAHQPAKQAGNCES